MFATARTRLRSARTLRAMGTLALSEGAARLLSFAFYVIAARALSPDGFGVVRYSIAIATLFFGALQVLAMSTNRELGAARGDPDRTQAVIGTAIASGAVLWMITAGAFGVAHLASLTATADAVGTLATLSGLTLFQLYYSIARGVGQVGRAAVAYVGGSLAQLVLFAILIAIVEVEPLIALLVFGGSSAVPILWLEARRPLVRSGTFRLSRPALAALWRTGAPLLAAQMAFIVWTQYDQVWVEATLGTTQVGLYSAAKNLSQVFAVVPAGMVGVLLPRISELREQGDLRRAVRLIRAAVLGWLGLSIMLMAFVIALRTPLIEGVYGANYLPAAPSLIGLAIAMTLYGWFAVITTSVIGWGRPGPFTTGVVVGALSQGLFLWLLAEPEPSGAAWGQLASNAAALSVVLAILSVRPLRT